MRRGTPKMRSLVRAFCIFSPLRLQPTARSSGLSMSWWVTIHGPSGP